MPPTLIHESHWSKLLLATALLSAYCLAGCLMEHLTLFFTWSLVSSDKDLKIIQQFSGMRTLYIYVLPTIALTLVTATFMYETRGHFWWQWWCMGCLVVSWVSGAVVQGPLQIRVRERQDRVALARLRGSSWVRTGAMVGNAVVVCYVVLAQV
ncbi:hypothetical protein LTR36_008298 [Oleoguttula mirabilis]|uniref:Uncharacterized protein n=1 Tax=Oleoguttula mirabilis TaxID=1507867 RepID=A0AAV9J7P1_9PEZI|nr:hypothetical protein LTR36_008298 [Oleoguttula mirabilis]